MAHILQYNTNYLVFLINFYCFLPQTIANPKGNIALISHNPHL